jgi:hypothetical protein
VSVTLASVREVVNLHRTLFPHNSLYLGRFRESPDAITQRHAMATLSMEKSAEPDTRIEKAIVIEESFYVKLDKRLNRKFDIHILPWLFGIW